MQIVIDIDEKIYEHTQEYEEGGFNTENDMKIFAAIRKGTPLPKGHGRLVDEEEVLNNPDGIYYDLYDLPAYMRNHIPTVVEADKEVDE